MFAGFIHPFRERNALEEAEHGFLLEYLGSDAGNDQEDEWLGWDAWVYVERSR